MTERARVKKEKGVLVESNSRWKNLLLLLLRLLRWWRRKWIGLLQLREEQLLLNRKGGCDQTRLRVIVRRLHDRVCWIVFAQVTTRQEPLKILQTITRTSNKAKSHT